MCQIQSTPPERVGLSESGSSDKSFNILTYLTEVRCRWLIFTSFYFLLQETRPKGPDYAEEKPNWEHSEPLYRRISKECFSFLFSLTCAALQRDALAISELVSWAAVEAAISCHADGTVFRAGLAQLPFRVEEPLRTHIPTLALEEVPGYPELV